MTYNWIQLIDEWLTIENLRLMTGLLLWWSNSQFMCGEDGWGMMDTAQMLVTYWPGTMMLTVQCSHWILTRTGYQLDIWWSLLDINLIVRSWPPRRHYNKWRSDEIRTQNANHIAMSVFFGKVLGWEKIWCHLGFGLSLLWCEEQTYCWTANWSNTLSDWWRSSEVHSYTRREVFDRESTHPHWLPSGIWCGLLSIVMHINAPWLIGRNDFVLHNVGRVVPIVYIMW